MNITQILCSETVSERTEYACPFPDERMIQNMKNIFEKNPGRTRCFLFFLQKKNPVALDMYVWTGTEGERPYRRFILSPGVLMTREEKREFDEFCHDPAVIFDRRTMLRIFQTVSREQPELHLVMYRNMLQMIHHIYCAMQRGVEEMLYKAGLGELAFYLNEMEEYNLLGTTPSEVFDDLSIRLLRQLNSRPGTEVLKTYERRMVVKGIYRRKPQLFRTRWTVGQCRYFAEVICRRLEEAKEADGAEGTRESIEPIHDTGQEADGRSEICRITLEEEKVLKYLACCLKEREYYDFLHYTEMREALAGIVELDPVPDEEGADAAYKADYLFYAMLLCSEGLNQWLRLEYFRKGRRLEYEDTDVIVRWPGSVEEIYRESQAQSNCLWRYMFSIAYGRMQVVFMRRKDRPEEPFVTLEIMDRKILQARTRFNGALSEEMQTYVQAYALGCGLEMVLPEE